jgi:Amiloride-sensitive sodium channel
MVAVVYIDDFSLTPIHKAWPNIGQSMATGIRVTVHDVGTKPDTKTGVSIAPGAETTLSLTVTNRVRLPPPFQSQCTTKKYVGNSKTMQYTVNACIDDCYQNLVGC